MSKELSAKDRIILALDTDDSRKALKTVKQLRDYVGIFKVGMQLFSAAGPRIIEKIREEGCEVFYDGKFHDIPNTVYGASYAMTRHQVKIFNVHASGGSAMIKAAVQGAREASEKEGIPMPELFAVSLLTSMGQKTLTEELGYQDSIESMVLRYGQLAVGNGIKGIIASPHEIQPLRKRFGEKIQIMTPGVRPIWASFDDQKRVMTPKEAISLGVTYIVIGRPVTAAKDPVAAVNLLIQEMEEAH